MRIGGRHFNHADALARARQLIDEGADIIDIGGESTRPGAAEVSPEEEVKRVVPLVEALACTAIPLSVDTSKPEVMRAALAAGAAIINDVRALQQPGAAEAVAEHDCGVVLMHMQGTPGTMQQAPYYRDVTKDVVRFLAQRVQYARARESTGGGSRSIRGSDSARPTRIISRFWRSCPNSNVCKFLS